MGTDDLLRPSFINFVYSENILLEGVTIINSPMWVIHPLLCNSVTVRDVYVCCLGPNNDGCDPESCTNVIIEDCTFDVGDDCIAIKSGRNEDGRRAARPSENIIIRDCFMQDGHGGVVLGSEISAGAHNIFVENCEMSSPELKSALRFKSSMLRGGKMNKIYARNIKVGECITAILIDMNYESKESGERIYTPLLKEFYVDNLTIESCEQLIYIDCIKEVTTVDNIYFNNVNAISTSAPNHISGQVGSVFLNGTELSVQ